MLLELGTVASIVKGLAWIHSFSADEITNVKKETEELLIDLSKSLVNLYDVVEKITNLSKRLPQLSDQAFGEEFRSVYAYCNRFYFDQNDISKARTHCGDVERDVERIKYKLSYFLRTDIGRWGEANEALKDIIDYDGTLLSDYDRSITKLRDEIRGINQDLENKTVDMARRRCELLGKGLESDLSQLKIGVDQMEATHRSILKIVSV